VHEEIARQQATGAPDGAA